MASPTVRIGPVSGESGSLGGNGVPERAGCVAMCVAVRRRSSSSGLSGLSPGTAAEVAERHGVSYATNTWRKQFWLEPADVKRLRQLEQENAD